MPEGIFDISFGICIIRLFPPFLCRLTSNHLKSLQTPLFLCLTLSHIQTLSDASATDNFWKHCGKREKFLMMSNFSFCQNIQLSFQLYSTKNHMFIDRDFPYFCLNVFKVICCKFSVRVKALINPFPTYNKYEAEDFEKNRGKIMDNRKK